MPYAWRVLRVLLPLMLIAAAGLWLIGRERVAVIPLTPQRPANDEHTVAIRQIAPEENLTQRAARGIAEEIFEKNPQGPAKTKDDFTVTLNPAETLRRMLENVQAASVKPFEGIQISELRFAETDSANAKELYAASLQDALARTIGTTNQPTAILDAFNEAYSNQNADSLAKLLKKHQAAIAALKEIPVPPSLAALHKKEIDLLMKTSIMLEGMALVNTDPMRAFIALQTYPALAEEAQALQQEFSAALSRTSANLLTFFIKSAQAAVPTIETHPLLLSIFPRDQYEHTNRIITELVKGNLLNVIRGIVLDYIKGNAGNCPSYLQPLTNFGGQDLCPKIVTNWVGFLFKAERTGTLALRDEIQRANLPPAISSALIQYLTPPAQIDEGQTLDELYRNVEMCDPNSGDPIADLLCISVGPANPDMILTNGIIRKAKLEETYRTAKMAQGIAGQGYLGTEQCAGRLVTDDETGETVCLDSVVTKPGSLDQGIQEKIETSNIDQIVNAFDWQTILANLVNMFINQLIQQGFDGLFGLIGRPPVKPGENPVPIPSAPPPPGPIVITFNVTPSQNIEAGMSATISWNATNAESCSASGAWSGSRPTTGSEVVTPPETSTYTLTCTDQYGGIGSQSVTITVRREGIGIGIGSGGGSEE